MVIRVTTKDGTKHKILQLLNLNTKKREEHVDGIPKVFEYTSDSDWYGKLNQTIDQLGDKQLKPSESRYDIREGNLMWIGNLLNPWVCVLRK